MHGRNMATVEKISRHAVWQHVAIDFQPNRERPFFIGYSWVSQCVMNSIEFFVVFISRDESLHGDR